MSPTIDLAVPDTKPEGPLLPGEVVEVVFWHPRPNPHSQQQGYWDFIIGVTVAVGGPFIVYTTGQGLPHEWGNELTWATDPKSGLRFARPEMVFRDGQAARAFAATLPPPGA